MKISLKAFLVLLSLVFLVSLSTHAQPRRQEGFRSTADSLRWWKYTRFNEATGYTKEERTILDLMENRKVRIKIGSKVKVLTRKLTGEVLPQETFWGTVVAQRHQVFYTVRDSLNRDFEYHLFDIELPKSEVGTDPAKKEQPKANSRGSAPH